MKTFLKRSTVLLLILASLAVTVFTGCGEKKKEINYDLKHDVTDKTEAFFIDADEVSAVSIDGTALSAEDYMLKNGYILFNDGLYSTLGKGDHTIVLTSGEKTSSFKLTVTDEADIDYVLPEVEELLFVGSDLPKVTFSNDIQAKEVDYSLTINGEECELSDNGRYNRIESDVAGDCKYTIKITRNDKVVENKVYNFKTTNNVVELSSGAGIYFGAKALSVAKSVDSKNDNVPCMILQRLSWDAAEFHFNNDFILDCLNKGLNKVTVEYRLDYIHPNASPTYECPFNPRIYDQVIKDYVGDVVGGDSWMVTASSDYTVKSFTFEKDFKFKENESFCFANLRNTAVFYVKGIIFSKG